MLRLEVECPCDQVGVPIDDDGRVLVRIGFMLLGCAVLASACGGGTNDEAVETVPGTAGTTRASTTVSTVPLIDSAAIRARYGFGICGDSPLPGSATEARGVEIIHASVEAGIAQGGSPGGDGQRARLGMFVLDDPSLAALAEIATPAEVCVTGQDPNDYVPLGPQQLQGPGWRWVGAGAIELSDWVSLIADEDTYHALWVQLGDGPETEQVSVDFTHEVILAVTHGSGVNFGRCGHRFDGYQVEGGAVVLNWFSPGGDAGCLAAFAPATYAIALDLDTVGQPPLTVAFRYGPRDRARDHQTVTP